MKQELQNKINEYRKSRDKVAMAAMQTVLSAVQERENRENKELSDNDVLKVIESEKCKYDESADAFKNSNAEKYAEQIKECIYASTLLGDFLPKKVDKSMYGDIADKAISDQNAQSVRDMGKVMTSIKDDYGVSIEMKDMSAIIKDKLIKFNG